MNALTKGEHILKLHQAMQSAIESKEITQIECPLEHFFANGLYGRKIFVPAGATVVTGVHKKQHMTVALEGHCVVIDEIGDRKDIVAPCVFVTEPGTQRAVYAVTDTSWLTVHAYEDEDKSLETVEKTLVCDTMEAYNRLLEAKV